MKKLSWKVCGMRDADNIKKVLELQPDFIGFIFYEDSPRFVNGDLKPLPQLLNGTKRVGVFVNESIERVTKLHTEHSLDYVQLHGDEDLSYCLTLREKGIEIIKVFSVSDHLPGNLSDFEEVAAYFLFDTSSKGYGGSGQRFDWTILNDYTSKRPFLLSGGLRIEDIDEILSLDLPYLAGIDVNSRFELEPGLKDVEKLKALKEKL